MQSVQMNDKPSKDGYICDKGDALSISNCDKLM